MIVDQLHVLSCSDVTGRPVVRRDSEQVGPLFSSYGNVHLVCGACAFLLIRGAREAGIIRDAVLVCPNCGANNEARHVVAFAVPLNAEAPQPSQGRGP